MPTILMSTRQGRKARRDAHANYLRVIDYRARGLSLAEIARLTELSVATVKRHLRRARFRHAESVA